MSYVNVAKLRERIRKYAERVSREAGLVKPKRLHVADLCAHVLADPDNRWVTLVLAMEYEGLPPVAEAELAWGDHLEVICDQERRAPCGDRSDLRGHQSGGKLMRVYVAGSSRELDRAAEAMAALRAMGVIVTSTWVENIRELGRGGNPRDATIDEKKAWASGCLRGVRDSGVLWLLMPVTPTAGCWVELGFAMGLPGEKRFVVSGIDQWRSIFTAYADVSFETDGEAVTWFKERLTVVVPKE